MAGNSLAVTRPDLAVEADGWDPAAVTTRSNRRLPWRCPLGHRYEAIVSNRTRPAGTGCPYCSGRYAIPGETDLATVDPELAAQAVGWDPRAVLPSSAKALRWRCAHEHEWVAKPSHRSKGHGCPYCSGRSAIPGVTDLATTNPELANQAVGWDPSTLKAGSSVKRPWACERGHEWEAVVATRSAGNGCPYCANKLAWPGFNDLTTTDPDVAAQAFGWDPTTVLRGSHKRREWRCAKGHVWSAAVGNRAIGRRGCPVCANKLVVPGVNDLATTDPEVAAQAAGWDPSTVTRSSNKRRMWECPVGHQWPATVADRTRGFGCPVCTGREVRAGINDLATTHPFLVGQAVGWDPTTVSRGSDAKRRWRCAEGHDWATSVSNRVAGKGCPECATSGFSAAQPAWLYLFEHDGWGLLQIGITNSPKTRLAAHERAEWRMLDLRGPMDGDMTRGLESAILIALRARGVHCDATTGGGRFSGYTESWPRTEFDVRSLSELLDLVDADDAMVARP